MMAWLRPRSVLAPGGASPLASLLTLLAMTVLATGVVRLASSAGSDRGGPARQCYDCHKEAKQKYGKKKFVHAPLKKNECAACHRSHGFSQQLVLQQGPVGSTGAAPDCSAEILCLSYRKR